MTDAAASRDEEEGSFEDYFAEYASDTEQDDDTKAADTDDQDADDTDTQEQEAPDEAEQLRQERDALRKERDDLDHAYKSQVGRVSALQKKIDAEQLKQQETGQLDDDEIKSAIEDYPEIAGPIVKYLEKKYSGINSEIEKRLAPIQEQEQQRYIDSQVAYMNATHPDWHKTVNSPEYAEWLRQQPDAVQGMDNTIHAKEMEFLVKSFSATKSTESKEKANDIVNRRQQKLAANVTIPSKGESKKSVAPDDFESAWKFYASKR